MNSTLNILMLEDSETDAEIVQRLLKKDNPAYNFKLAMTKKSFLEEMQLFKPDIILADNSLPQFNAKEALHIVNQQSLRIPFIMVTGTVSEEFAVDIIKQGADDYILKDRISRLPVAIRAALKQRKSDKEKNQAMNLLVKSEENLKAIFDSATEAFILTDTKCTIKDFNNQAKSFIREITHRDIEADINLFDFIEQDRKEYLGNVILKILAGETILYDKLYLDPMGMHHWINFSFSPVKKRNIITGICITGRDITEKKIAEHQKEFDHNNLQALINNTHDLMWSVDRQFKLITSNQAFDDMVLMVSGVKPEKGTDILIDLLSIENIFRFKVCYQRAFAGETFTEIEHTVKPVELWSEISFYPIYEGYSVIGTACYSRNITARKKAEEDIRQSTERLSAILNTLPANIALLDAKGIIIDVNDAWKRFANQNGYTGNNYGIMDSYLTISNNATGINEQDGKIVAEGIRNVLNHKIKEFVFEYPCDAPDIQRWFRMVVTPLTGKEYGGAVVMHVDISEIRRLEKERLESKMEEQKKITRAMLKAEEKERTRLGQELHDNISQLLAATKMKLGFCLAHPEKSPAIIAECTEYVQEAMTEARNLSHKMVIPRFDENGFKESILLLCQKYQSDKKTIRLETKQMDEMRISPEIKETLYRILQEQLNNIEKYASASEVEIQIITYQEQLDFVIRDNGVGFDLNKKSNGIGLTNIFNRTESYNGFAQILTEPGKGCTLLVEIPLAVSNIRMSVAR